MSPRSMPMVPLTNASYWRRLLATVHPDQDEGDAELFVFLTAVREFVEEHLGTGVAPVYEKYTTTPPPAAETPKRIPYDPALGAEEEFVTLTHRALSIGQREQEPFRSLLALPLDCPATEHGRRAARQCRGASYRQLAWIGHAAGCDVAERSRWYEIAKVVPPSEAHASHLIWQMKRQATA